MNYISKLQSIVDIKGLFDFREELLKSKIQYNQCPSNIDALEKNQEINFYVARIDAQIESLERRGVFLPNIVVTKESEKS
jgi:hypothetical protein